MPVVSERSRKSELEKRTAKGKIDARKMQDQRRECAGFSWFLVLLCLVLASFAVVWGKGLGRKAGGAKAPVPFYMNYEL